VYGAAAGSKYYFEKPPSDLSLAQAAMLAGLIRSPNRYSPNLHLQLALERRNLVIDAMLANGDVQPEPAKDAKAAGLNQF
jgi:penicillin-binding protein 1A